MSTVLDRPLNLTGRDNPVLLRLVAAIRAAYGPRIERIVLFGSRARGDFEEEDSDYDVAVFMHGLHDGESGRLWEIERSIIRPDDPVFEFIPLRAGSWADRTTFMHDIRNEGIDL
jgi:uncharacterized protein